MQGGGGGLLAGLSYALIRSSLPAVLWAGGSALTSAMWGVGTFIGPAVGGLFAQFGLWRWAFLSLAVLAALIGAVVPFALPASRSSASPEPFPVVSLLLVVSAALLVSVASVVGGVALSAAGVLVAPLLVALSVRHERRSAARVLPSAIHRPGSPLRWIYPLLALLAMGSTTETFVPLFGQRLAGLEPLAAGFLGAALAAGWTLGELPSAGANRPATVRRILLAGPVALAAGLALAAAAQGGRVTGIALALWVLGLLVAGGGIGMAWPHLATLAMGSVTDPAEGDKASAAINTVQLLANAVGAALTGVAVNLGEPDPVRSAHYLFGGFAVLALGALVVALVGTRRPEKDTEGAV